MTFLYYLASWFSTLTIKKHKITDVVIIKVNGIQVSVLSDDIVKSINDNSKVGNFLYHEILQEDIFNKTKILFSLRRIQKELKVT
jgi:predicted RNA-binding protein with RPS1 domain